jgi:hypothetical protein
MKLRYTQNFIEHLENIVYLMNFFIDNPNFLKQIFSDCDAILSIPQDTFNTTLGYIDTNSNKNS